MQVVVFSLDAVGTLCCDDDLPHRAYLFVLDVVDHLQLSLVVGSENVTNQTSQRSK